MRRRPGRTTKTRQRVYSRDKGGHFSHLYPDADTVKMLGIRVIYRNIHAWLNGDHVAFGQTCKSQEESKYDVPSVAPPSLSIHSRGVPVPRWAIVKVTSEVV